MAGKFILSARLALMADQSNIARVRSHVLAGLAGRGGKGIVVPVGVKVDTAQLNKAQQQLNSLNTKTKTIGVSAAASSKGFSMLSVSLARVIAVGSGLSVILNGLRSAAGEAVDFNRQIIKIGLTLGQTASEAGKFADTILKISSSTGVSSAKLADSFKLLVGAGISAKEATALLSTLANTELGASFEDISKTTESVIAIFQQFGKSGDSVVTILDAISKVSREYAIESKDIVTATVRSASTFAAAGSGFNEYLAVLTTVRSQTRESAESIGNSLKSISSYLQTGKVQNFLTEKLGISLRYTADEAVKAGKKTGDFVGVMESMQRVSKALAKTSPGSALFAQTAQEIGGIRNLNRVLPLLTNAAETLKIYESAQNSAGDVDRQASEQKKTLSNQFDRLRESAVAAFYAIGQNESMRSLLQTMLALGNSTLDLVNALNKLTSIKIPSELLAVAGIAVSGGLLAGGLSKGGGKGLGLAAAGAVGLSGIGKSAFGLTSQNDKNERVVSGTGKAVDAAITGTLLTSIVRQSGLDKLVNTLANKAEIVAGAAGLVGSKVGGLGRGVAGRVKGAATIGIAGNIAGSFIQEQGLEQLRNGSEDRTKAIGGSILSQASTGAAAGFALGGPFLGAVGAATGALLGFIDGVQSANDVIRKTRVAGLESGVGSRVDNLVAGNDALSNENLKDLGREMLKLRGASEKGETAAFNAANAPKFQSLLERAQKSGKTFKQLEDADGGRFVGMAASTLGLSLDKLEEKYTTQLKLITQLNAVTEKLNAAQSAYGKELLGVIASESNAKNRTEQVNNRQFSRSIGTLDFGAVDFSSMFGANSSSVKGINQNIPRLVSEAGKNGLPGVEAALSQVPQVLKEQILTSLEAGFAKNDGTDDLKNRATANPLEVQSAISKSISEFSGAVANANSAQQGYLTALQSENETQRAARNSADSAVVNDAIKRGADPTQALFGRSLSPESLGGSSRDILNRVADLSSQIQANPANAEALSSKRGNLLALYDREATALNALVNSTGNLEKAQDELNKKSQQAQNEFSTLESFLSKPQEFQELSRQAQAVGADPSKFQFMDAKGQQNLLSFLGGLGNQSSSLIGGKNAQDIRQSLVKQQFGVDPLAAVNQEQAELDARKSANEALKTSAGLQLTQIEQLKAEIAARSQLLPLIAANNGQGNSGSNSSGTLFSTGVVSNSGKTATAANGPATTGTVNIGNLDAFKNIVAGLSQFSADMSKLQGLTVAHTISGSVEILINGDSALNKLSGDFQKMVLEKVSAGLNNYMKKNFQGQAADVTMSYFQQGKSLKG